MSNTIKTVAIAGGTGSLGSAVAAALVRASFEVTALTRDAATAKSLSGVKYVGVDYSSPDSLKQALKGQDAVISALSGEDGTRQQITLFDAAIALGVKRVLPSEFGSDTTSPQGSSLPAYKLKVDVQNHIKAKIAGTQTTYTILQNNAFLDWGIRRGFLINAADKKAKLFDGGDVPFKSTPLDMIGDAVAGVLKHPTETANRVVRVHGVTVTLKQLLHTCQKYQGTDGWQISEPDTEQGLQAAYGALKSDPHNFMAWGMPMIFRAAVGRGMDCNWEKANDNELLGIRALNTAQVEEMVKDNLPKA